MVEKSAGGDVQKDFEGFLADCPSVDDPGQGNYVTATGAVLRTSKKGMFALRTADNAVHEIETEAIEKFDVVSSSPSARIAQVQLKVDKLDADLAGRLGSLAGGIGKPPLADKSVTSDTKFPQGDGIPDPFKPPQTDTFPPQLDKLPGSDTGGDLDKGPGPETVKELVDDTRKEGPFDTLKEIQNDTIKEAPLDTRKEGPFDTLKEVVGDKGPPLDTLKEPTEDTRKEGPFDTLKEIGGGDTQKEILETIKEVGKDPTFDGPDAGTGIQDTFVEGIPGLPGGGTVFPQARQLEAGVDPAAMAAAQVGPGLGFTGHTTIKEIVKEVPFDKPPHFDKQPHFDTLKEIQRDTQKEFLETIKEVGKDPTFDGGGTGTGIADTLVEGIPGGFPGGGGFPQQGGGGGLSPFVLATPHQAPQGSIAQQQLAAQMAQGTFF